MRLMLMLERLALVIVGVVVAPGDVQVHALPGEGSLRITIEERGADGWYAFHHGLEARRTITLTFAGGEFELRSEGVVRELTRIREGNDFREQEHPHSVRVAMSGPVQRRGRALELYPSGYGPPIRCAIGAVERADGAAPAEALVCELPRTDDFTSMPRHVEPEQPLPSTVAIPFGWVTASHDGWSALRDEGWTHLARLHPLAPPPPIRVSAAPPP